MAIAISRDGTEIAYSIEGAGPSVILVDGAMCYREMGPMRAIAEALGPDFQVYYYDRRGRGESGDTKPYAPEREIEDLAAMIEAAGGEAYVCGISSGAILAAHAARELEGITKLALYEGPMVIDGTYPALPQEFRADVERLVQKGDVSGAVKKFMGRVGMPGFVVWFMSLLPMWKTIISAGHTLPYDLALVENYQTGRPLSRGDWRAITIPALVMDGGNSPDYMRNAQEMWADMLPNAEYRTLPGQTHNVKTEAIVPVLGEFFR